MRLRDLPERATRLQERPEAVPEPADLLAGQRPPGFDALGELLADLDHLGPVGQDLLGQELKAPDLLIDGRRGGLVMAQHMGLAGLLDARDP
jgi:hypothetical protein